jgi:hypothetical protein
MVEMAGVEPASLYRSIVYLVTSLSCFFMLLQTQHSISFICLRILSELQFVNMNNFFYFCRCRPRIPLSASQMQGVAYATAAS